VRPFPEDRQNRGSIAVGQKDGNGQWRLNIRRSKLKAEIRERGWFGKTHEKRVQSDWVEERNISAQSVSVVADISEWLTAQLKGPNVTPLVAVA
jgi:hypothetical protein